MLLHHLIQEILCVPPERTAHATYTAINAFTCPSTVARNKTAEGAAEDAESPTLVQSDPQLTLHLRQQSLLNPVQVGVALPSELF